MPQPKRPALALILALATAAAQGSLQAQTSPTPPPEFLCAAPFFAAESELGYVGGDDERLPSIGSVSILFIFAQFKDEAPGDLQPPTYARDLFNPERLGSFTHFYHTMSQGQLQVEGTVLPRRYVSQSPAKAYRARRADEYGGFEEFVREILRQVDADYDLGQFDNDGPDEVPNSGDDDGAVDYLVINLRSSPKNFILGPITGAGQLGFGDDFVSAARTPAGEPIRVEISRRGRGAIFKGPNFTWTVGSMAHEFGHALGLPDLFDRSHLTTPDQSDDEYSAGIGMWGLMGHGTLGWNGADGPNPLSAWCLEQLGWIGQDNGKLVYIEGDSSRVRVDDVFEGGTIYKIPLEPDITQSHIQYPQYLLLEYCSKTGHYYNRHLPQEGLLVWHVRYKGDNNNEEDFKLVDLVCADGLYEDAGYPQGLSPSHQGRDNLDFWAKSEAYRLDYGGNMGDESDPFDGRLFSQFSLASNPSTKALGWAPGSTGLSLLRMRPQGDGLVLDIEWPRWRGTIDQHLRWVGPIQVDGDLTIAPEGSLTLYPGAKVLVAGSDQLAGGRHPERVEIRAEGALNYKSRHVYRFNETIGKKEKVAGAPPIFQALVPGQSWAGISTPAPLDTASFIVRDIYRDLPIPQAPKAIPTAVVEEEAPLFQAAAADTFSLGLNYPNPFTEQTTLPFSLAAAGQARLTIYNALGQPVRRLVDEVRPQGSQEVTWAGRDEGGQSLANGVYLYQLEVPERFAAGGKMLYLASGYAQLLQLDEPLQEMENAWPTLQQDLGAPRAAYGYAGDLSGQQAAFQAGAAWVQLQLARRAGSGDGQSLQSLQRLVPHLDPQDSQQLIVQLEGLESPAGGTDAQWGQVHDRLLAGVRRQGEKAVVYFNMGVWLESLRGILGAARSLGLDLTDSIEPAVEAQVGRLFGVYLEEAELAAELEALARLLEGNTRGVRALDRLFERIERVAEGVGS